MSTDPDAPDGPSCAQSRSRTPDPARCSSEPPPAMRVLKARPQEASFAWPIVRSKLRPPWRVYLPATALPATALSELNAPAERWGAGQTRPAWPGAESTLDAAITKAPKRLAAESMLNGWFINGVRHDSAVVGRRDRAGKRTPEQAAADRQSTSSRPTLGPIRARLTFPGRSESAWVTGRRRALTGTARASRWPRTRGRQPAGMPRGAC